MVGLAALDANDRIIYNNGTLNYDSNGNLAGGEQLIAVLCWGKARRAASDDPGARASTSPAVRYELS